MLQRITKNEFYSCRRYAYSENYFNYKLFMEYSHTKMTKQGAMKILDHLASYNILEKSKNRKGEAIFKFNPAFITYKFN